MSTITDMREHLMQTLAALRDRDNPMDVDRARAVAQVAGVLVDSAKVEVDYIKATGTEGESVFMASVTNDPSRLPSGVTPTPTGLVHRIKG
ncbi:hypothetical protein FVF58_09425 [Paraburkholderia panacisoli]|uniref:Uncharacterized protein n=1 Tax=Paraburkholderia panacisoli TaxID=2603818 RepID=A0A5B0HCW9_9BURK|nr:hypothetical protein [Paraburkholderia panacisoli]KAA1013001.1 hypothetical protein FVF58_09425 [Paraburkholderia panacisoli]